jgi:hypothetical protein
MNLEPWPFDDPPDRIVITTRAVVDGTDWVALASHDAEDGVWQFFGPGGFPGIDAAITVCLSHVVETDESIGELADLPRGWVAERSRPDESWLRKPDGD